MKRIILYDGDCGLCNRFVVTILKLDSKNQLYFSSLQSEFGQYILKKFNLDIKTFDSFLFLNNCHLQNKSSALFKIIWYLGGFWRILFIFKIIPKGVRDKAYDIVARNRYRLFGQNICYLSKDEWEIRFIKAVDSDFS